MITRKKGLKHLKMGLTKDDLSWAIYPEDSEIFKGVEAYMHKTMYIGMEIKCRNILKLYGWRKYSKYFQRTYRKISNLDDIMKMGHTLFKSIKFGMEEN